MSATSQDDKRTGPYDVNRPTHLGVEVQLVVESQTFSQGNGLVRRSHPTKASRLHKVNGSLYAASPQPLQLPRCEVPLYAYVQRDALSSLHKLGSFFCGFLGQEVELTELGFSALVVGQHIYTPGQMRSRDCTSAPQTLRRDSQSHEYPKQQAWAGQA